MQQYQEYVRLREVSVSKAVTKLAIGLASSWLIVALIIGAPLLAIAAAIALIGDVAGFLLHRLHKDTAARVVWLQGSNIAIFLGTQIIHPDGLISLMLFAMMAVTFIIFSWRFEVKTLVLNALVPIVLWYIALASNYSILGSHEIGEEVAGSLAYLSGITSFILTISVLTYFNHIASKVEQDLIESRNQAHDANKAKSEFLACMSHELRTPLTSLIGSLGLIEGGAVGSVSPKAKELIKIGNNNANKLLVLINDILDISKIEAGKVEYHMEPIDINELISTAIKNVESFGRSYSVEYNFISDNDKMWVNGDINRLTQVINNLLSNAAKFSDQSNRVDVVLKKLKNNATIQITDYGIGIPKENHSEIFTKFYQVDSSSTRKTGGTGLGLSISKSIIEAHHGTLEFESETGKGTTFCIKLKTISLPDDRG